jgi:hypothetical protein
LPQVPLHWLRCQAFSVFFDHRFGKSFEVLFDFCPLEPVPGVLHAPVEFLFEHEGEKAAKDMAPYGFIQAMVDGPGLQNPFHVPECVLHLP